MSEATFIALSGGFDPVHIGHIRMINAASKYGKVIIILNSDKWLMRKKGFVFQSWMERAEILENIRHVESCYMADDKDNTVSKSLLKIKSDIPHLKYFGNGGDRTEENIPELDICKQIGIEAIFGLGGPKIQSSSKLTANVQKG